MRIISTVADYVPQAQKNANKSGDCCSALGMANHVTVGEAFLRDRSTVFSCNGDRGHTWMTEDGNSDFAHN
eukprot:SAG31_NODE_32096_length_360_cov_0.766284_1_plen_70_part_10